MYFCTLISFSSTQCLKHFLFIALFIWSKNYLLLYWHSLKSNMPDDSLKMIKLFLVIIRLNCWRVKLIYFKCHPFTFSLCIVILLFSFPPVTLLTWCWLIVVFEFNLFLTFDLVPFIVLSWCFSWFNSSFPILLLFTSNQNVTCLCCLCPQHAC